MFRSIVLLVGGLASLTTASLPAQEAVLSQEYGAGVHAFFASDYLNAHQHLTTAIEGGSKDPRAFYFRGLACVKLGRGPDAVLDFRKGAELESSDVNRFYDVGKALERVQGAARVELENYRVAARMAALEQAERLRKARYEAMQREESRVLREQAKRAPADESDATPPAAASGDDDNPFATPGDELTPEKAPKSKPGKKASPKSDESGDNPFETEEPKADKKPKTKPDDKNKKPDDKKKKKADEDDPFGGDEPAAPEKPKTDKPKTEKPKTEKPKADEKKPGDKGDKKDDGKKGDDKKEKKPDDKKAKKPEKKPDDKAKKGDPDDPFA